MGLFHMRAKKLCGAASGAAVLWNLRPVCCVKLRKVERVKAAREVPKADCWKTGRAARKRVVVAAIFATFDAEGRVGYECLQW
jgi:hypothetical protein